MRPSLANLVELLALEPIATDRFRGASLDLGWGSVFGGQVLGQALSAADQTVPVERVCHSMHGDFLRPGDVSQPIEYAVDRIRDGGSFTTRRVVAMQHEQAIFSMAASFQRDEGGLDYQEPSPPAPGPDGLVGQDELERLFTDGLPAALRAHLTADGPLEARPVAVGELPDKRVARKQVWFRARDPIADDPHLHRHLLAYASDFHLLLTALLPHGVSWLDRDLKLASLDHAMWFHRPFRMDDWLLYDMEAVSTSGGRGMVRGRILDRQGALVASTIQEGLMRYTPRAKV
jgi:acyl-CoA thioesterase II